MDVMQREGRADPDASAGEVWRCHAPAVLRFATALVGPADAHDIATTAFLRMTRRPNWASIEHPDRYWMKAVANEAKNLYRQRRRRWERDVAGIVPAAAIDGDPDLDLRRAIAALSVEQRSVVFLAYWLDLTEAEIADRLGVSRGTVHRTLVRARTSLRRAL